MKDLISTVIVCIYFKTVASLDCYWNTECKYKYFSSKTPYEILRGDIRDSIVKPKGCEPISVWAIIRHGKRNPGIKFSQDIKDVLKLKDYIVYSYEHGNSTLCAQDVENLKYWKIDASIFDEPNAITNEGHQEINGIGSRLKEAIPELLNELQENDYLFCSAITNRTQESAKDFVIGLKNKNLNIEPQNNSIAAPYVSCGKFQLDVFQNPNRYRQVIEYMATADYLNMKERIEKRLGLNLTLTYKYIIAMYDVCRYTWEGIGNKSSPWCAVFSVEDLQVLEYIGDLEQYHRNGYGVSHYSNIFGQLTLADLLTNFEQAKKGNGKKIVSYITHSTMLNMILVTLNLNKDVNPLTGAHRDVKRKFRTTFISTFAVNMIAILNRCKKPDQYVDNYNVVFYWNEKPLLELCNDGVCSWQELEDKFKPFLNATTDFCKFKWE